MASEPLSRQAGDLAEQAQSLSEGLSGLAQEIAQSSAQVVEHAGLSPIVIGLTVLVLAVFVGGIGVMNTMLIIAQKSPSQAARNPSSRQSAWARHGRSRPPPVIRSP